MTLRVEVGISRDAVVAAAAAVQEGQDSSYVFLVGTNNQAQMRKVVVDRTVNDEAVIRSGLEGGEQVVIDGQSRLIAGSTVEIVSRAAPPGQSVGSGSAPPKNP